MHAEHPLGLLVRGTLAHLVAEFDAPGSKVNSTPANYVGRSPSWDGFDADLQKIIRD